MAYTQPMGYYPMYPAPYGAAPDQLSAYKAPYQPQMQPQPMMPTAQNPAPMQIPQMQSGAPGAQTQGNGMIFVMGDAGAKSYPVAPGASVVLWDRDAPMIYIKSADQNGIPSMQVLRWEYYVPEPPQTAQSSAAPGDYVRTEDFRMLESKIESLSARVDAITRDANRPEEVQ